MIPVSSKSRRSKLSRRFRRTAFFFAVLTVFAGGAFLGAWHFENVQAFFADAPSVSMTSAPVLAENKMLLLSYEAADSTGIREISLRVTPHSSLPGANNASVEIILPVPSAKKISRTEAQDLSSRPWAGQEVDLQIVAVNGVGKRSLTAPFKVVLPQRRFLHPIARVLIEERNKLLQCPDDSVLREEAANIMASIAHDPANYRGDPVVLMALRSGAVRLVLGHDRNAAIFVNDILWQTAARIEDQNRASLQRTMREIRQNTTREF
ncbi:MAG: DUF4175 family protein [Bdellovibrionales bacterium]